jgi:lipid A 3-O-deacylase
LPNNDASYYTLIFKNIVNALILLIMLAPTHGLAQNNQENLPWVVNIYFENDLFGETDQSYTNGIRFSWTSPDLSSYETDKTLPN